MSRLACVALLAIILALTACDLLGEEGAGETAPEASVEAVPLLPTAESGTPAPATPASPAVSLSELRVWLPPQIANASESARETLNNQLLAFNELHPEVSIIVEEKPVEGAGGILDYLRSGRNVAPRILPDVVTLPSALLEAAYAEQLIFPLDEFAGDAGLGAMYDAALRQARPTDDLLGYPFAISSLMHLAYDSSVVTDTVPSTWSAFIRETEGSFAFPAQGETGARLVLAMYQQLGGVLDGGEEGEVLDVATLAEALNLIQAGRQNGFILAQSVALNDSAAAWPFLTAGTAATVLTSAEQFLAGRGDLATVRFTPVPGPTGTLTPLVSGWLWALSTPHSEKQALAAELIFFLGSEANAGAWTLEANLLPTSQAAFASWPAANAYTTFLQEQLALAAPLPAAASPALLNALTQATIDVAGTTQTPQSAAETALASLQP